MCRIQTKIRTMILTAPRHLDWTVDIQNSAPQEIAHPQEADAQLLVEKLKAPGVAFLVSQIAYTIFHSPLVLLLTTGLGFHMLGKYVHYLSKDHVISETFERTYFSIFGSSWNLYFLLTLTSLVFFKVFPLFSFFNTLDDHA